MNEGIGVIWTLYELNGNVMVFMKGFRTYEEAFDYEAKYNRGDETRIEKVEHPKWRVDKYFKQDDKKHDWLKYVWERKQKETTGE